MAQPFFRALFACVIALMVMAISGCTSLNPITEPKPAYLEVTVNYGPPEFKAGYEDGCKSSLAAYGNTYMKTIYSLRKRPEYQYNNMYNQVWRDAWNYCYMSYFLYGRKDILYGDNVF
jgi:hypothetical protein